MKPQIIYLPNEGPPIARTTDEPWIRQTAYLRADLVPLPEGQSKRGSLSEALTNVAIGYGIALGSQLVIFPMYEVNISLAANVKIGLWFTAISIARSYMLRRAFNWVTRRSV